MCQEATFSVVLESEPLAVGLHVLLSVISRTPIRRR
jgi:hypothetical protein